MEIERLPVKDGSKQFDAVEKGDIVVLPANGATVDEMMILSNKNVQVVDTTCPWVSKVLIFFTPVVLDLKSQNSGACAGA